LVRLETEDVPDLGLRQAFRRGGEMGARMARLDWSATPLGPIAGWSPALRGAVRMLLASKAQIVAFWGPEQVALYNDAYAPTIGDKHPDALGRPGREHWGELWDVLGPLLEGVRESGEAFAARDHPFTIERHGFLESVYFDISYDPVFSESGAVEGVYCVVSETTERVLAERRLNALRDQIAGLRVDGVERRSLALLDRVGSGIVSRLDLHEIVQLATDAATELTGAAFGAFFYNLVDETGESYTLYTISGVPREAFSKFPMPRNTQVFGPTFNGEGVVRIHDVLEDPRYGHNPPYHGMPPGHLPVRSYLAVPVVTTDGAVEGGLFLGHSQPGMFSESAEAVALNVARHAAIAMVNARLYEAAQRETEARRRAFEERDHVARVLQESLLPPALPAVPGLEIAARYVAGDGLVGGDFYDVFALGDGRWGFVLGDVCGRGAEAASVTALTRHTARSAAMLEESPAGVIEHVNAALLLDASDLFVTALFGHIAPNGAAVNVRLCAAGHPPPLVARADGGVEAIASTTPLLGVVEHLGAGEAALVLRPGDALLLYTDGLIEARHDGRVFGPDRLMQTLADAAGRSAEEMADALLSASQGFGPGAPIDDTALLILRVAQASPRAANAARTAD
jgi:serine phosphatase RsbU (regulator of sigma subunit)